MRHRAAARSLALALVVLCVGAAGADGLVVDLTGEALDATTLAVHWLCTDTENPAFTVTARMQGVDRTESWETRRNYYEIRHVLPGTAYEITVASADRQTVTVTTPEADAYTDYGYRLLDTGLYQAAKGSKEYTALAALYSQTLPETLRANDIGFLFQFRLTASKKQKSLGFELLLQLPNGDVYALSDILWYAARSQTHTQQYAINGLLQAVYADYGGFPTGEYTLHAYFNGDRAADMTFTME